MIGKCVLLLFGVFLVAHSVPESDVFKCPRYIWNGEKIGHFVGTINQDGNIHYLFKPANKFTTGCVKVDEKKHPVRAKLIMQALQDHKKVHITVVGEHEVSGIKIEY